MHERPARRGRAAMIQQQPGQRAGAVSAAAGGGSVARRPHPAGLAPLQLARPGTRLLTVLAAAVLVLSACGSQTSPTPEASSGVAGVTSGPASTNGDASGPGSSGTPSFGGTNPLGALQQAYESVVERVAPSVVVIETSDGLGSGIVFDTDGHIVTNAHVVGDDQQFIVTLAGGQQLPGVLVGSFVANDIAVIKVTPPAGSPAGSASPGAARSTGSGSPTASATSGPVAAGGTSPSLQTTTVSAARSGPLQPASFADSAQLKVGQIVLAVGNPLGLQSSVTNGIISSLGRTVAEPGGATLPGLIQTSAAINPGNSGGALVDIEGRVVGIPTLAAADPQIGGSAPGIGFAIPSNDARDFAQQLIQNGRVTKTHRAYLGIRSADVIGAEGVLVYAVVRRGPADEAGIRPGQLILSIGDKKTPDAATLSAVLATLEPGETVVVTVLNQDGTQQPIQVKLGELPG